MGLAQAASESIKAIPCSVVISCLASSRATSRRRQWMHSRLHPEVVSQKTSRSVRLEEDFIWRGSEFTSGGWIALSLGLGLETLSGWITLNIVATVLPLPLHFDALATLLSLARRLKSFLRKAC